MYLLVYHVYFMDLINIDTNVSYICNFSGEGNVGSSCSPASNSTSTLTSPMV